MNPRYSRLPGRLTVITLVMFLTFMSACAPNPIALTGTTQTPKQTNLPGATQTPQPARPANFSWLQFGGNPQHNGVNSQETAITPSNVSSLKKIYQVTLPGQPDTGIATLSGVQTPQGVKNVLYMTTTDGRILAVDASNGDLLWQHQYPPNGCTVWDQSQPCYTTSAPAIDPDLKYVYSYGLDGKVHKYQVGNGEEVITGGWPVTVTLKPDFEKSSAALAVATAKNGNSYLYVTLSGYPGDRGNYQGHLVTINLETGSTHIFNAVCSNETVLFGNQPGMPECSATQSAIWPRPGVVYDPATNHIYTATGNGTFDPSQFDWGDTVLALNPDGAGKSGSPVDSYTPSDYQQLQSQDLDLGSTAPAILPVSASSKIQNLGLQSGKDGMLRLINLSNLSGKGGPGNLGGEIRAPISLPQGGMVLTQPAVWVNPADKTTWVFVTDSDGISAFTVALDGNAIPYLKSEWVSNKGGTSPIIANGVLYYDNTGIVYALNPITGKLLWSDSSVGSIHWGTPLVANGILYVSDWSYHLTAYALNGTNPLAAPTSASQP
ncbi:MAG: PQQ-binding-like beta-propeller repeat protein [Chloroflexi bacterium]|nr:PQQ-binding-like beta-propeller repeat protein [Chloroflexota bacterium]